MTPQQLATLAEARDLYATYKANGLGSMLRAGRIEAAMRLIGLLLDIILAQQSIQINNNYPTDGEDR